MSTSIKILNIDDIFHEYQQTRLVNKRIRQDREEKLFSEYPELKQLDRDSTASYIEAAKARIAGVKIDTSANKEKAARKRELLKQAGYPEDYLDPIFNCRSCEDTGYLGDKRCHCFDEKLINALYLQSNLKNQFEVQNFSTFSTEYYSKEMYGEKRYSPYDNMVSILKKSKEFAKRLHEGSFDAEDSTVKGNLLLFGQTGLGKTFLTNCIAKELLDQKHTILYLSAQELFEDILAGYVLNHHDDLEPLFDLVYNCELLIIDDLGTEFTNEFVRSRLFELLNKRIINKKSTLISTNLNTREIDERYSQRIMSRIFESYTVFEFYGDNVRYAKRIAEQKKNI